MDRACVLRGHRVVIPQNLRQKVVAEFHKGHPEVVRMKALAKSYVWWHGLDSDIEEMAKICESFQATKNLPAKAPLYPWAWPTSPWERVHIDFAGPLLGKMFLIVVDAHSKWPEIAIMTTTTTKTITALREIFSRNGIPRQIVSDNGPQFMSGEFSQFMSANGIEHIRSSPYHQASNGAAERLVQTLKRALKAGHHSGMPLKQSLSAFLLR